jgi:hypothetical protein
MKEFTLRSNYKKYDKNIKNIKIKKKENKKELCLKHNPFQLSPFVF